MKNILLVFLSIGLIITGFLLYQEREENNNQYKLFLNKFYDNVNLTLSYMENDEYTELEEGSLTKYMTELGMRLEKTNMTLEAGRSFVSRDIPMNKFTFFTLPVHQFAENGELTAEEMRYLEFLEEKLTSIQSQLYSEDTGQENPNISVEEFGEIIALAVQDRDYRQVYPDMVN